MQENGKSVIWEPGEIIYEVGSDPKEAYLILEGYVNIETKDGLKLNRLGMGEIFGETSILLNVPRTVTAKVCAQKLVTKIIPKTYFKKLDTPRNSRLSADRGGALEVWAGCTGYSYVAITGVSYLAVCAATRFS